MSVAALGLGACGDDDGGDELKTVGYERAITRSVLQQHDQNVKVECPETVPNEKGSSFTCNVKLQVGTYPVKVTFADDKGNVKYGNTEPLTLLDIKKVERAIGLEIRHQRHLGSDVTCPEQVLQKQGLTFFCDADVEGGTQTKFRVEQTDDAGNVTFVGL